MSRLSPESSRRRFFTVRFRLSDDELHAMTHLDGHHRFALGATVQGEDGATEGVGIARFARVADTPDAAEVALVVVDAYQRQGVGRTLLSRLAREGLARGITRFRGSVLPDNDPMLRLLRRNAPGVRLVHVDGHLNVDVQLNARMGAYYA